MKKAFILFIIVFLITLVIPLLGLIPDSAQSKGGELVTIFQGDESLDDCTVRL